MLPSLRGDIGAFESYTYEPKSPVSVPFSVIYGSNDALIKDKTQVSMWKDFTTGPCDIIELPGCGHFIHEDKTYLQTVNQIVSKML